MSIIDDINKTFDHRVRLGIMSVLMVNEYMDFTGLKEILDVTDGNLASHAKALEQAGYITVQKQFIGRKPNTRYIATSAGKTAFRQHLNALEKLINRSE
ncbi:transcriptional regulator [Sinomicrobium pectinilyticum]|uniref:Transcriptional regulator n=1 Tax=Sinomicrobium pectinilyticum TaxID=1084421 RepID=A0A3N0ED48_SINP1|nr:transcriptional regulator [Sinomicrobium pectinilyticum]RNL85659.1 transcriptional regulator [Sinomicrobium pectinilyticum]